TVSVRFGEGDTIEDVGFEGRGCAISQAATSMLTDLVKGRTASEVATMPKDELLDEIGIPLTPVRLKCALLGLGVLKVALHRAKGTPLPEEWGTSSGEITLSAIEDRCSHDDGPLCEGEWDAAACEVVCPRHGSRFDLRTGTPLSLPAY